jgi:hypothetical protein
VTISFSNNILHHGVSDTGYRELIQVKMKYSQQLLVQTHQYDQFETSYEPTGTNWPAL